MNSAVNAFTLANANFGQITTRFDSANSALWSLSCPKGRPCFSNEILAQFREHENYIKASGGQVALADGKLEKIRYVVYQSSYPGVFNLGGDLDLFRNLIRNKDEAALLKYAIDCIDPLFIRATHYDLPLTTISLVQGQAFGGGFECALASNHIVAERSSVMGFPEMLFNLFPGMGAYSFLSRRVGSREADRIISSGKTYSAHELYEFGVVDQVVEDGMGVAGVEHFMHTHSKRYNANLGMQLARERLQPLRYAELRDIAEIWVARCLELSERDLRIMDRLVNSQHHLDSRVALAA